MAGFAVSDELLGTFVPIAVYWLYSGLYVVLGMSGLEQYRLHTKGEEDEKNVVSKGTVVRGVLVQQAFQVAVSLLLFTEYSSKGTVRASGSGGSPNKLSRNLICATCRL